MSFYSMHRGWMDNPVLRGPLCRAAAWAWLIENACWKSQKVHIKGKTFMLERGQLSYSVRFLAEAWQWPKSVVDRFIDRLETETMIRTDKGTAQLVITICNYDRYQSNDDANGTVNGTHSGTAAGQQRDSSGTNKNKDNKDNKENNILIPNGINIDDQPKKSRKKPLTTWPEGFVLTSEMATKCREKLPAHRPQAIFEEFQDWNKANGRQYADWQAAFRTWVSRAANRANGVRR